jgi:hypothetical protein
MMEALHYDMAYNELVDYLLQFCSSQIYGAQNAISDHPRTFGGHAGFCILELPGDPDAELHKGDLLLVTAMSAPEFRLSWLLGWRQEKPGQLEYLLRSAKGAGNEIWWGNIGIAYFHRPTMLKHPEWSWTNEQHLFAQKWKTACYEDQGAYMVVPVQPVFFGSKVALRTRKRYALDDYTPSIYVENFHEATRLDLGEYYKELVSMHTAKDKERTS